MLRPSTVRSAGPAFGIALSGLLEYVIILLDGFEHQPSDPTEQFRPITSTGHWSSLRVKCLGIGAVPQAAIVFDGYLRHDHDFVARHLARRQNRLADLVEIAKVSRISRSMPGSPAPGSVRETPRDLRERMAPSGSMRTPNGPTAPATYAKSRAASRANRRRLR